MFSCYRNSALENRIQKSRNVSVPRPRRDTCDNNLKATLSNDEINVLVDMNQWPQHQGSGFDSQQDQTFETTTDTNEDHNIVLGTGSDTTPFVPVDIRSLFCVKKMRALTVSMFG